MIMEVDFVTSGILEEELPFEADENIHDNYNFEGERCGICMDIVIDRGVLDCCHHWFCFGCIDNWATITNLCPLCQNEFQSITCVPVYDTIGNNKVDEDSLSRDDDWSIEGKNNTLSFPSYYIDENLSAWMEMAARFEVDQQILRKNLISIPLLLAILVTFGIMLFVWALMLKGHQRIHGYARDAQLVKGHRNLM